MTTKIELEKMRFYAYHGVMPQETKVGERFRCGSDSYGSIGAGCEE